MASAPIKRLFHVSRRMIDPSVLGDQEVFHYSLPAWHEFGHGVVQKASDLSSGKLSLEGGEILVSKLNPEKSVVIRAEPHEIPTVCSPEMIALVPRSKEIDERCAYYLMLSAPVRHDLKRLHAQCEPIQAYADKRIAHRDGRGPERPPKFADLTAAIDLVHELTRSYCGFMMTEDFYEPEPVFAYDWQQIFRVPWDAPRERGATAPDSSDASV